MSVYASEDQWIAIQKKTFANWANEQLKIGNRSVDDLAVDLSDGVRLVALVEALQFRKIGKVFQRPTSRIQMLQNVSLALQAVAEDNVRLVNIGNDDIVDGNLKLTLGLLWHLILRYQISGARAAPPRKLMLSWFRSTLPEDLEISNLTSSWRDGRALHALLEHCKPGLSPNWRNLKAEDAISNCQRAMQLAKEKLGIPRVISAEDFASPDLDELSAMTYLSYFIKKNSPGHTSMLDWVRKQLKSSKVNNFATDWNDGQLLCSLVHSFGGDVPGWPLLDKAGNVATCQTGIDAAYSLGVQKTITASELADPKVDQLTVMTYLSQFKKVSPRLPKAQKCRVDTGLETATVGHQAMFMLRLVDKDSSPSKVSVTVTGQTSSPVCVLTWTGVAAECVFVPQETVQHKVHVYYDGEEIESSPMLVSVLRDISKVKVTSSQSVVRVGQSLRIDVSCPEELREYVELRRQSPGGEIQILRLDETSAGLKATFLPSSVGVWTYQANVGSQEVCEGKVQAFDPGAALLIGPDVGAVGEEVTLQVNTKGAGKEDIHVEIEYEGGQRSTDVKVTSKGDIQYLTFKPQAEGRVMAEVTMAGENIRGSPKFLSVVDRGKIQIYGDGSIKGSRGVEACFTVNMAGIAGAVTAEVQGPDAPVTVTKENTSPYVYRFCYVPTKVGIYTINVLCDEKSLPGCPYRVPVTDKGQVKLVGDMSERQDETGRLALATGLQTVLRFTTDRAGPGIFSAEVLSPDGKLPVHVDQESGVATVSFQASTEGDHYIHLYWSESPIECSPILAYCPGPQLPVNATRVTISGQGAELGRVEVRTDFLIDGRKAGPGVPKVVMQGVHADVPVEMKALQYDRYRCAYTAPAPGGFLLYVYWSDALVPSCPLKVTVTPKGDPRKVKVTGSGLAGGVAGQEWKVLVDTVDAGPGDVTTQFYDDRAQIVRCDVTEPASGQFLLNLFPLKIGLHKLHVTYDGSHVNGSPFEMFAGAPPDPSKVQVFGPGIEDGIVGEFESRFLVETLGAGAGQLAVKIRGPRGGFRVDMRRQTQTGRTINCRYDPSEPGEYEISVRWSSVHVPGSPFTVHLAETGDQLDRLTNERGFLTREEKLAGWRAEI
ncbi:hypothetical protein EGW08_002716 [Elysia chlorotica]|uniref:Calponin-homology (CH) domain-containing protein n=1 Tax=Elysia chlorotica TaxID=188477 RepID=A0A433U766_ELYCH|nr:hypothetical protein EGW08_002716 [Elysia chlorotica]